MVASGAEQTPTEHRFWSRRPPASPETATTFNTTTSRGLSSHDRLAASYPTDLTKVGDCIVKAMTDYFGVIAACYWLPVRQGFDPMNRMLGNQLLSV